MRYYCCEALRMFIEEDEYGTTFSDGRILLSCIKEMSNDTTTCLNIVIQYCPFCGKEIMDKAG